MGLEVWQSPEEASVCLDLLEDVQVAHGRNPKLVSSAGPDGPLDFSLSIIAVVSAADEGHPG